MGNVYHSTTLPLVLFLWTLEHSLVAPLEIQIRHCHIVLVKLIEHTNGTVIHWSSIEPVAVT